MVRALAVVLLGSGAAAPAWADLIVVPGALATTEGNGNAAPPAAPFRYMQIYDASEFAGLGPVLVTHVTFRPDTLQPGPGSQDLTLQLFLSTTSQSLAALSPTFAANVGPDNTLVFSGLRTATTAGLAGPGTARQFDVSFALTAPFVYDPGAGNLLIDFQVSGASAPPLVLDAVAGTTTLAAVFALGSPVAATGDVQSTSLVTQFTVQAVPEPSTLVLAALGLLASLRGRRRGPGA